MHVSAAFAVQGLCEEARESAERAFHLATWQPAAARNLAGILARLGAKNRAAELLAKIPETASNAMVIYHLLCSEIDNAADWYEKQIESRQPYDVFGPEPDS